MKKNKKKIRTFKLVLAGLFASALLVPGSMYISQAKTEKNNDIENIPITYEITPRAWIENFTINLLIKNGNVIAEAKNEFTFPMATMYTQVKLYSSTFYTQDISQMTLEAQNSITDLDTGNSISAQSSINGRQLYWRGLVIYKDGNNTAKQQETLTICISADGVVIG